MFEATAAPTLAPTPGAKEIFDFAEIKTPSKNEIAVPSTSSSSVITPTASISKDQSVDPIALLLGFGIGMLGIALVLWRRQRLTRQQNMETILRHVEANSPYCDTTTQSYSDAERFVEIDLQTLHQMN